LDTLLVKLDYPAGQALATEVVLKDGRVLRGKLGEVTGLADILQPSSPDGEGPNPSILLMDDDLSRTFVSKRLIKESARRRPGTARKNSTFFNA